jgi:thioredoxin reductase (NADPH)
MTLDAIAAGGQAGTAPRIENYLGFPSGLSGSELAERAVIQAEKFGARISVPAEVVALDVSDGHYVIRLDDGTEVATRTVVIASGVRYRRLPVERLGEFEGTSVFYAATEIEAQMCAGDPVVVVGGGNSAGQASLFLAKRAASLTLVIREGELGADMSRYLVEQIERNDRITVRLHSEVREVIGDHGALDGVVIENNRSGERATVPAKAIFVFIGAEPHVGWLADKVALDDRGFVLTGSDAFPENALTALVDAGRRPLFLETSQPGVFAAGDVRSGSIKRVAAAVGEGSMAIRFVHEHLDSLGHPGPDENHADAGSAPVAAMER